MNTSFSISFTIMHVTSWQKFFVSIDMPDLSMCVCFGLCLCQSVSQSFKDSVFLTVLVGLWLSVYSCVWVGSVWVYLCVSSFMSVSGCVAVYVCRCVLGWVCTHLRMGVGVCECRMFISRGCPYLYHIPEELAVIPMGWPLLWAECHNTIMRTKGIIFPDKWKCQKRQFPPF